MDFAGIATEIRRRAVSLPNQPWRGGVDDALVSLVRLAMSGAPGEPEFAHGFLLALAEVSGPAEFALASLDSLQPETIRRLDLVQNALVEGGLTRNDLRDAVRPALVKAVRE